MIESLSKNWFFEDRVDFELKKYILLSYLQFVDYSFKERKLYPYFADIQSHYNNLIFLRNQKEKLQQSFHSELTGVDIENLKLIYEAGDDKKLDELYSIINYAIKQFEAPIRTGNQIFKEIVLHLKIEPVGIIPIHKEEGYLLFSDNSKPDIWVYSYKSFTIKSFNNRISTKFETFINKSINNSPENIKLDLIKEKENLNIPAVFLLKFNTSIYPFQESLIPIGNRKILEFIYK